MMKTALISSLIFFVQAADCTGKDGKTANELTGDATCDCGGVKCDKDATFCMLSTKTSIGMCTAAEASADTDLCAQKDGKTAAAKNCACGALTDKTVCKKDDHFCFVGGKTQVECLPAKFAGEACKDKEKATAFCGCGATYKEGDIHCKKDETCDVTAATCTAAEADAGSASSLGFLAAFMTATFLSL